MSEEVLHPQGRGNRIALIIGIGVIVFAWIAGLVATVMVDDGASPLASHLRLQMRMIGLYR